MEVQQHITSTDWHNGKSRPPARTSNACRGSRLASLRLTLAVRAAPSGACRTAEMEFVRDSAWPVHDGVLAPGDVQCDEREKPAHAVRITKTFEMAKYEVTQEQWQAVMGNNPSDLPGRRQCLPCRAGELEQRSGVLSENEREKGTVTITGCRGEARWEYAARAGTTGHTPDRRKRWMRWHGTTGT